MFIKGSWAGVFACKVLCRSFPILPLFAIDVIFKVTSEGFITPVGINVYVFERDV